MQKHARAIAEWLRQRASAAGARGFVVGLSGGIDSAVVVRLCQMAAPGQVAGVIMPCHSDPRDESDARLVADHFGIPSIRVDLAPAYDTLMNSVRNAMALARQRGYRSIGFPLIGAGSGGGKADRVQGWMEDELRSIEFDGRVIVVRYKPA